MHKKHKEVPINHDLNIIFVEELLCRLEQNGLLHHDNIGPQNS